MSNIYDLIIIGGGPAGVSAGIYAARKNINTLLITKNFGGQIAKKAVMIENYLGFESVSGLDLIQKFENHLRKQKIDIELDEVTKLEKSGDNFLISTKNKNKFEAASVIVASGADPRPLEVPGEKEFIGRGVSYCPTCDSPFFSNKTVAVVGGGNAAFEVALSLSDTVKKVYILECSSSALADEINQEEVKKIGKVEIIFNALVKRIKGGKFVESLVYKDRETNNEKELAVDGVFVEIGSQPATSFLRDLVDFNERDEIVVDSETCQTKTPGLFAAGDVNIGIIKQIVTAASEGATAALFAYRHLKSDKK